MEPKDFDLSNQMTDYLINFCKTGNPNGSNLTPWISSTTNQHAVLRIGEGETRMALPSIFKLVKIMLTNKAVGE